VDRWWLHSGPPLPVLGPFSRPQIAERKGVSCTRYTPEREDTVDAACEYRPVIVRRG